MINEEYWKEFYSKPHTLEPTPFVKWANIKNKRVIDFGCGNGRDTYYLARDNKVIGVDLYAPYTHMDDDAEFFRGSIEDFLGGPEADGDVAYCRFLFHAVEFQTVTSILDWAHWQKATVYAEFRSDQDRPLNPDHKRYPLHGNGFFLHLVTLGFHITCYEEGHGLAKYKGEDPHIVRIVAGF